MSTLKRPGSGAATAFLSVVFIYIIFVSVWRTTPDDSSLPPTYPASHDSSDKGANSQHASPPPAWSFDPNRDRDDRTLTDSQCSEAFPKACDEIDRAAEFWAKLGGIKPEHLDISEREMAAYRVMIYDQQLYIIEARGSCIPFWRYRASSSLSQLYRAIITSPEPIPNIEFSVTVKDTADLPEAPRAILAFTRRANERVDDSLWLMPPFTNWAWKDIVSSYQLLRKQIREYDVMPFNEKIPKALWRGVISVSPGLRGKLVEVSDGKSWADVYGGDWGTEESDARWVSPVEQCKYMFPIYTEGTSWSGRLRYQLTCRSASIMHKPGWLTNLHPLFIDSGEDQNYIAVSDDWSDLDKTMEYYTKHLDVAERIANNSARDFRDRYATPAAETCYWRRLFKAWANVAFTPHPVTSQTRDDPRSHPRFGIPYEEYILDATDFADGKYKGC